MTRHRLHTYEPKQVRDTLNLATEMAAQMLETERELILLLREIDLKRFYVRYGYRSLMGFCVRALGLSRIQAHRIAAEVHRTSDPAPDATSFDNLNFDLSSEPDV